MYIKPYESVTEHLVEIHRFCAARNTGFYDLPGHLIAPISDIQGKLDTYATDLVHIINYRHWDRARLAKRGEGAKPRIDVYVTATSKGNISVLWWPRFDHDINGGTCDFTVWNRRAGFGDERIVPYRPENELLFVHNVAEFMNFTSLPTWRQHIERHLLYATRAMTMRIVNFLSEFYEVRVIKDFEFELDENRQLVAWRLIDPAQEWFDNFARLHGLEVEEFLKAIEPYRDAEGHVHNSKASRHLQDNGFSEMLPKTVEILVSAYEHYRQWPQLTRRVKPQPGVKAPVIPLHPI